MLKRNLGLLWVALLGVLLLASCSSNGQDDPAKSEKNDDSKSVEQQHDKDDSSTAEQKSDEDEDNSTAEEDHDKADKDTQDDTEKDNNHNTATGKKEDNGKESSATITPDTLEMEDSKVKQPTRFPDDETKVISNVEDNQPTLYTIDYKTGKNEDIATFTGTLYESKEAAADKLDDFTDGKSVPSPGGNEVDLGHGITGYGEGAAGHAYFSWEEGNWVMSIASLTKDEMDNAGIAEKMVDYLEDHTLPPPKDTGIVYVDYPEDGDQVHVDIRWQEGDMVYQLKTNEVPLEALDMTTSVK